MNKSRTSIICLSLISFLLINIPSVKADGSLTSQDVFISFTKNSYTIGGTSGGTYDIEGDTRLSVVNLTGIYDVDEIEITHIGIWCNFDGGSGTRLIEMYIYEYVADNDAGIIIGTFTGVVSSTDGDRWAVASTGSNIGLNTSMFFVGGWIESTTGDAKHYYEETAFHPMVQALSTQDGSPFNEGSSDANKSFRTVITFNAWKNTTTSFNQYYGSEDKYIARRDLSYSLAGLTNREIKITYPAEEKTLNISYYDGDWDQILGSEDYIDARYNGTHKIITIPEATISAKGDDFRLFTETYDYQYTLYGLICENGTNIGAVNVSFYLPSETDIFEVDGTALVGYDEKPIQLSWELSGGLNRRIYINEDNDTYYIYSPDADHYVYPFYVKDYCNYLGQGDCFVESLRIIDGEERYIERIRIQDSLTSVPLILSQYKIYIIQVKTSTGDSYRFGYYTPGVDPSWTLRLKGITFSENIAMSSKFVFLEGRRLNGTHLQGKYLDELDETSIVEFEVKYRANYTIAYSDNSTSASVEFNWYEANNETDYIIHIHATHARFPSMQRNFPVAADVGTFPAAPDMGILGNWGPLDGIIIFPLIILMIFGNLTDETNAEFGAFILWCTAAFLSWIGWYPNSGAKLAIIFIFIILMAFGNRRGQR